jgi:branched-chain amino acid aminotransferase
MHINAGALHYGVSVFEGMKAFESKDGMIQLVKPQLNAARMQRGADALLMPRVPESMFIAGVKEAVRRNREFVPPYGHGASMYIRPLLFASGPMLGLAPLAQEFTFFVCVMPTAGYFQKQEPSATAIAASTIEPGVKAFVSEKHDRAAPRGTGAVKAAGNYAADLNPVHTAQANGYNTTLYLDAKEQRYVEEFSVANFIGITKEGVYVTPSSSTILASTTNELLMEIARSKGMKVEQRPVDFDAEIDDFAEIGMCGTAAVVVRVESITRGGRTFTFDQFDTIGDLRATLTGIQHGDVEDTFGFMDPCATLRAPF